MISIHCHACNQATIAFVVNVCRGKPGDKSRSSIVGARIYLNMKLTGYRVYSNTKNHILQVRTMQN